MNEGIIQIYCGDGHGKSAAALGQAIHAASLGKNVIIIKFLKSQEDSEFMTRLEPEIKVFRFEKSEVNFEELSESEKQEEVQNIRNG